MSDEGATASGVSTTRTGTDPAAALGRLDVVGTDPSTAAHVSVGRYIPLELATGPADRAALLLSLRRADGLGLFDIRLDATSGALSSATLVLYEGAVSPDPVGLDAVRRRLVGTPSFAPAPDLVPRLGRPAVERAVVPLACAVHAAGVEVSWSERAIDTLIVADGVAYHLAAGRWVGLAFTALAATDRRRLTGRLGPRHG